MDDYASWRSGLGSYGRRVSDGWPVGKVFGSREPSLLIDRYCFRIVCCGRMTSTDFAGRPNFPAHHRGAVVSAELRGCTAAVRTSGSSWRHFVRPSHVTPTYWRRRTAPRVTQLWARCGRRSAEHSTYDSVATNCEHSPGVHVGALCTVACDELSLRHGRIPRHAARGAGCQRSDEA